MGKQGLDVARFPLFILRSELLISIEETLSPVMTLLAWSFDVCLRGVFPANDPWLQPLPEPRSKRAGESISGNLQSKWHVSFV